MSGRLADELADLALAAAREAAGLVRARRTHEVTVADTKSSDVDVVTEADRATEDLLRRLLRERRPDDAFLGEEGDDVPGTTGVRWVLDPIDGTVNFLYDLPAYAVSVAAEVDGEVVAGVVLDVAHGAEYVARPDADGRVRATVDGRPIAVRPRAPLAHRLIGTGFSYEPEKRALQGAAVARLLPRVRDVRRFGSCAIDLCLVASGRLDGYVEEGTNLWDHAAGGLVVRAAGGRVEHLVGTAGSDLLVSGPADGFDDLLDAVVEAGFTASGSGE